MLAALLAYSNLLQRLRRCIAPQNQPDVRSALDTLLMAHVFLGYLEEV